MTHQLLDELEELVETLNIGVIAKEVVRIREFQARFLLGAGKVEEVLERARAAGADCLVIDAELSPSQQRNWEAASGLCVIDRQEVILDIFHERAQTKEAVLQVELARSEHSLPRLKNAWTHLSRQRGGGSVTQRGEGEAQIELDQRMVRQRISRLRKELSEVIQHREVQRKQRMRIPIPSAAIVGYTNAGKSTLLNRMTGSSVLSEDKLFATLDPTTRQLVLPDGQKVLLTDTVGFVRRLPHQLVEAFKATLEEAVVANLLIHVVDVSNPEMAEHQATTLKVLKELGAGEHRIFTVYNKVDAATDLRIPSHPEKDVFYLSAHTGEGVDRLSAALASAISDTFKIHELLIPHSRYDLVNTLHERASIRSHVVEDEGVRIVCAVPPQLETEIGPFIEGKD